MSRFLLSSFWGSLSSHDSRTFQSDLTHSCERLTQVQGETACGLQAQWGPDGVDQQCAKTNGEGRANKCGCQNDCRQREFLFLLGGTCRARVTTQWPARLAELMNTPAPTKSSLAKAN